MKLDENYTLTGNSYGWSLVCRKEGGINEKTGKPEIYTKATYHATMYQALKQYIDDCLQAAEDVVEVKKLLGQALSDVAIILSDIRSGNSKVDNRIEGLTHYPITPNDAYNSKK